MRSAPRSPIWWPGCAPDGEPRTPCGPSPTRSTTRPATWSPPTSSSAPDAAAPAWPACWRPWPSRSPQYVRARREIEADRAKPRATARYVTLITVGVLLVLGLTGQYIQPYSSPVGQVILVVLLSMYVATLVWMRAMATGKPLPRFIGATAREVSRT